MQESAGSRTEIEELLILIDSEKDGERSRSIFVVSFSVVTSLSKVSSPTSNAANLLVREIGML